MYSGQFCIELRCGNCLLASTGLVPACRVHLCLGRDSKSRMQMIKETMDKKFGAPWHVVAGGYFSYDITFEVCSTLDETREAMHAKVPAVCHSSIMRSIWIVCSARTFCIYILVGPLVCFSGRCKQADHWPHSHCICCTLAAPYHRLTA